MDLFVTWLRPQVLIASLRRFKQLLPFKPLATALQLNSTQYRKIFAYIMLWLYEIRHYLRHKGCDPVYTHCIFLYYWLNNKCLSNYKLIKQLRARAKSLALYKEFWPRIPLLINFTPRHPQWKLFHRGCSTIMIMHLSYTIVLMVHSAKTRYIKPDLLTDCMIWDQP